MDPSRVVVLIDEWNPRARELQDAKSGLGVGQSHQDFVEKLVLRLDRLDLDDLVLEGDERLALDEAINHCRAVLRNWNEHERSKRQIVGADRSSRENPIIVIRRILSNVEVTDSSARLSYPHVFISHASDDRCLAERLDDEIKNRLPGTSTFVASRPGNFPAREWFDTIKEELRRADAYITIVSQTSKDRPWVLWEHGAAWMSKRKLITTRAGIAVKEIPEPLRLFHISSLSAAETAAEVFRELGDTSGESLVPFCEEIERIVASKAAGAVPEADLAHEDRRDDWISRIEERIRDNVRGKSIRAARQTVAALLERLPPSLRAEEKRIVELAHNSVLPAQGFAAYWQELEGVRGRGALKGQL